MQFSRSRHASYYMRNLNLLPHHYMVVDHSRLSMIFFCIFSLDILGVLPFDSQSEFVKLQNSQRGLKEPISTDQIEQWIDWIYDTCLLPDGSGFRGTPATAVPKHREEESKELSLVDYDIGNVAGTYFALATLVTLRDNFSRINRDAMRKWLRKCQRPNGSFGAFYLKEEGEIYGEHDLRILYCASAIRMMLGVPENRAGDIDISTATRYVLTCITYDGGISNATYGEGHAGLTYCGIGALRLLGVFDRVIDHSLKESLLKFLVFHQDIDEYDDDDTDDSESCENDGEVRSLNLQIAKNEYIIEGPSSHQKGHQDFAYVAGFNGRFNKPSDTCYSFWTGASLEMIGDCHRLCNPEANIRFLLSETQHQLIGGFGKLPGALPDLLHSCLGLAAISLSVDTLRKRQANLTDTEFPSELWDLKTIDPTLCISIDAKNHLLSILSGY
ncbi:terpenoid cyclases/protein prenyltransferase alpha-alpha toroid [Dipodascopsis uninucleata]